MRPFLLVLPLLALGCAREPDPFAVSPDRAKQAAGKVRPTLPPPPDGDRSQIPIPPPLSEGPKRIPLGKGPGAIPPGAVRIQRSDALKSP